MKKRFLSWLLVLTLVTSLIPSTLVTTALAALAAGDGVNIADATTLTNDTNLIENTGTYKISGARQNPVKITAAGKVVLVLDGVTITTATSPIELADGAQVTLVVKDDTTNTLTCTAAAVNAANSGKTAGILVPESASLTIDRAQGADGTGSLTVTGGYGGAGIGGAAAQGYTKVQGTKGGDGGAGSNGKWAVQDIMGKGGAKGTGGLGGFYGQSATNAGTITINAGTVNAVGGQGGAGIGGGRGGDGQIGQNGKTGGKGTVGQAVRRWDTNIQDHHHVVCGATGSSGAGGNGNTGGPRVGNQNKNVANHYGWTDVYWYPGFGGAGGNGEGGKGGVGGAGGDGGTLTITGGKVQSNGYTGFGGGSVGTNGQKGSGTRSNGNASTDAYFWWEKGGTNRWADAYCGEWRGNNAFSQYSRAAGNGGNGGTAAAAPTANANGAAGTLKITGSSYNVDFVSNGGGNLTNGQPTDKNKDPLYRVELTIYDLEKDSKIKDANVNVEVPGGGSKVAYTYKTVSENNGKAVLWLPAGDYTLEEKAVNHATLGSIPKDSPVTLTVQANNSNKLDVMIGVPVHVAVDKENKVYFAQDSENPLNIRVDTSEVEQKIDSVKWFRETVNGNDQEYAKSDTGTKKAFDEGYGKITDGSGNKGTLTKPTEKVFSLPINQNGRYWVQIEYQSNGAHVKLVKGLTVNNIYRSFPIQVRSQEMDRDGKVRQTGEYGPLKNAIGLDYNAKYGFAWDLNGYHAADVAQGTLLANPPLGYDKVSVFALDSKAKWYTAHIDANELARKDDRTGFKAPFLLTLNQDFLTNNTYSDLDDGSQKHDISKYTITYKPDGVPVAEFPIRGILQNADGSEKEQLWQIVGTYPEGVTEATIDPIPQPGYRVDSVLVDGEKKDLGKDNSIHLTNLQGTQDNHYTDAIKKVEFVYVSNMVEVTVNCVYNGKTHSSTISLEKGIKATVTAPTIDGYTARETAKTITPSDTVNEVVFNYTQNVGNITVIAVEKTAGGGETELYRKDGGTVNRDNKIELTGDAAAPAVKYFTKTGDAPEVKVNNVVVPDPTIYTYDGSGDVTVTYTYTRDKHSLTVKKVDIDNNNKEIPGSAQTIPDLPAGKQHLFGDTVATPINYAPVGGVNPIAYLVEDGDGEVTFYYRKEGAHRYAEVTVECFYTEKGQKTVFHSYQFPAFKDMETTITAPILAGYRLKVKDPSQDKVTIKPTGAAGETVRFEYELDAPRSITVKLVDHENKELTPPKEYKTAYTIKKGDSVQISAPPINGYTLTSQNSVVTVEYTTQLPSGDNTVTFTYQPVSQANFVTHTVKFMLNDIEIYEYEKLILKAADTTEYTETSVTMTIPGYKLNNIELQVGNASTTDTTAVNAPNDKDAAIIYHFAEDAAEIVIRQKCTTTGSGHADKETILKGYREGQTGIKVLAPPLEGHALKNPNEWQKEVPTLKAGQNIVEFEYIGIGDISFELIEHDTQLNQEVVIQRVNGELNQEYNPELAGNLLNLTDMGYQFVPCADADDPFKVGGTHSVKLTSLPDGNKVTYRVHYQKNTRPVHFYAIDSALYPKPADMNDFDLDTAKKNKAIINGNGNGEQLTEKARVAETYKASALSIDFYKLDDDLSKYYYVENTANLSEAVNVYFWYRAKGSEDVTVSYQAADQTILTYTVTATKGEKLALKAPDYLEGGKYKRADSQDEKIIVDVTSTKTVKLQYVPNFVNVTVQTVTNGETPSNYDSRQVNKTDAQGNRTNDLTLTPPYKGGYTLVGIAVQADGTTTGGADEIPGIYDKSTGKLNLTNLDKDTVVTYYYKTTTAGEYQVPLTIRYLYNGYALKAEKKNFPVNRGEENTIEVPAFDGYTASAYTFQNGTGNTQTDQSIPAGGLKITPTAQTDLVLTITYTRADDSVVLPGKDGAIDSPAHDKDNVIVKPDDPAKTPTLNPDPAPDTAPIKGSVTILPDTTATVTRPTDPDHPNKGKEDITVPGGTTIDPDGTIHLPNGGPVIGPDKKIPDALENSNFIAITYDSNNGSGEVKKVIREKGKLTVAGKLFEHPNGYKFEGWYGNGNGTGNVYATGQGVTSITLYAKWSAKYRYFATITYKPNGGTPDADKPYIVGHDTDQNLYATLQSSFYQVSGWDFGGWNEQAA